MTPPRDQRDGLRMAAGVLLAAVAVVAVALVAGGSADGSDGGPIVAPALVTSIVDAASFALMTLGFVLAIAVMVLKFGGLPQAEDRKAPPRKLQLAVVAIAMLLLAPPALGYVADWLRRQDPVVERDLPETAPERLAVGEGSDAVAEGGAAPVVGIGLGLVGAGVVAAWLWSGSHRGRIERESVDEPSEVEARDLLHLLLDEAIARLRDDPDPRAAVIATWARLEVALDAAGFPRHRAEAPRPYLERVLGVVQTSAPAARRLAVTFERAMFSPHTIDRATQVEAVDALVAVRDELAVELRR